MNTYIMQLDTYTTAITKINLKTYDCKPQYPGAEYY